MNSFIPYIFGCRVNNQKSYYNNNDLSFISNFIALKSFNKHIYYSYISVSCPQIRVFMFPLEIKLQIIPPLSNTLSYESLDNFMNNSIYVIYLACKFCVSKFNFQ
jgi:hypothetical protein